MVPLVQLQCIQQAGSAGADLNYIHGGMNLRKAGGRKCGSLQKHKFLHSTQNHFPEFPPLCASVQRKDHSDWFRTGLANAPAVGDPGMLGTLGTLKEQAGRSTCPTTLQI